MKSNLFRIVSLLLILTLLVPLSSCKKKEKNRTYDEGEVLSAVKALLPGAEVLNEIYYGKGIAYDDGQTLGNYAAAKTSALDAYGFRTIAELKEKTAAVYTDGVCEQIASTKFQSVIDEDNTVVSYARYYEKDGTLYVDTKADVVFYDKLTLRTEEITVDRSVGEKVYVFVPYTVENKEGKTQSGRFRVSLIEEKNGWRLNYIPYTNYNANLDYYSEIKK